MCAQKLNVDDVTAWTLRRPNWSVFGCVWWRDRLGKLTYQLFIYLFICGADRLCGLVDRVPGC
jgi:hypothetical protein